jgi:hypothetical protein
VSGQRRVRIASMFAIFPPDTPADKLKSPNNSAYFSLDRTFVIRRILFSLALLSTVVGMSCFAADITTRDGTTYHNAQVTGVDPDGIHVTHSIGVAKLRFEELPDALQKQYHYDPGKVAAYRKQIGDQEKTSAAQDAAAQQTEMHATAAQHATGTHGAADLFSDADSALRNTQYDRAADALNAISSQYPSSRQAQTVRDLELFLRQKQTNHNGPLTIAEAKRLRSLMTALNNIRASYRTATPQKRRDLETVFGKETFDTADSGLNSLCTSALKLRDATDNAIGQ